MLMRVLTLGSLLYALTGGAAAQTAQLTGLITDQTGAVIPGARLTLLDVERGVRRETESNDDGLYTLTQLPPGNYQLVVEKTSFKTLRQENITLQVQQVARFDFVLEVGATNETVTVTSSAPVLDTETSSLGKVVDQHPDVLVYSVKFSKRRSAHGHRIFYREIEGGIRVIRVLHIQARPGHTHHGKQFFE